MLGIREELRKEEETLQAKSNTLRMLEHHKLVQQAEWVCFYAIAVTYTNINVNMVIGSED